MDRPELLASFHDIRRVTECLCQPLLTEDYVVQPILDVSPPKWHLGHTTWFFEQVLLQQFARNYRLHHERYSYIFNSYYQSFGERVARELRGTLSRPSVKEVYAYRAAVDESMHELIETVEEQRFPEFVRWTELHLRSDLGQGDLGHMVGLGSATHDHTAALVHVPGLPAPQEFHRGERTRRPLRGRVRDRGGLRDPAQLLRHRAVRRRRHAPGQPRGGQSRPRNGVAVPLLRAHGLRGASSRSMLS